MRRVYPERFRLRGRRAHLAAVLAGQGVFLGATFLVQLLLARLLRPADNGQFQLAFTLVAVIAVIVRLGLPQNTVRLVASELAVRGPLAAAGVARIAVGSALVASIAAVPLLGLALFPAMFRDVLNASVLAGQSLLLAVITATEAFRYVVAETVRGYGRIGRAVVVGDAARAASFLAFVAVFRPSGGSALSETLVLWLAASLLVGAIALPVLGASMRGAVADCGGELLSGSDAARVGIRSLIASSMPLLLVDVANFAVQRGDVLVAGATTSASSVAIYSIAVRVAALLMLPYLAMINALAPSISSLWATGDRERLESMVRRSATASFGVMLLAYAGLSVFGYRLLTALFGSFYGRASTVLLLVSVGPLINCATGMCEIVLTMAGRQAIVAAVTWTVAPLTLGLEYVAARHFGLNGLAVASAGGTAAINLGCVVLAYRILKVRTWPSPRLRSRGTPHPSPSKGHA